jgi:putative autotransporter adhesin-like protein
MRVKLFVGFLIALAVATLIALAVVTSKRHASPAETIHDVQSGGSFRTIKISGLADITLRQGSRETVTADAGTQAASAIHSEIHDGTLTVTAVHGRHWSDWFGRGTGTRTPRVIIDFIDVSRIEAAGAVKLSADRVRANALQLELAGACSLRIDDLRAAKLEFEGSGAINTHLAGTVDSQDIAMSGAGSYDAASLVTDRTLVQLSGAAKAIVNAKTSLEVDLSGASAVDYLGDPHIEQQVSGISKLRRRDPL